MAHPIRPDSYQEINNFYTATVYEKGAEVIRMLHTLLGQEGFRNGMDLYFSYFDGQAVTCDDFVEVMSEANNGFDLDQFMRWYSQAGTPRLRASGRYDAAAATYTLTFEQTTPPTPGQVDKLPLLIPVALGLIGRNGADLPLRLAGEAAATVGTRVLELTQARQQFQFVEVAEEPVPSLLRGFSAPVILELDESDERLAFRMAHDSDAFNRWDATQRYAERVILALAEDAAAGRALVLPSAFVGAIEALLTHAALDPAFLAQALTLPGEAYLLERMMPADPVALRQAVMAVTAQLGKRLASQWLARYAALVPPAEYRYHPADAGKRALRNLALRYLAAAGNEEGMALARQQFERAGNMTERFGALAALVNARATHAEGEAGGGAQAALAAFRTRYRDDALVLDKWFALQATAWRWSDDKAVPSVLETVQTLMADAAFSLSNPNKVYALLGSFFRGNAAALHAADGQGYVFWADQVIALDGNNPQVASRMARALENWRRFPAPLRGLIEPQLRRVLASPGLSPDVTEIVGKALAGND